MCQDHEKQGKIEELSKIKGEQGEIMTKCNVVPWIGSWKGK